MIPGPFSRHRITHEAGKRVFVGEGWGYRTAPEALAAGDGTVGAAALWIATADEVADEGVFAELSNERPTYVAVGLVRLGDSDEADFAEEHTRATLDEARSMLGPPKREALALVFVSAESAASPPP